MTTTVLLDCRVISERLDGLGRYAIELARSLLLREWDGLKVVPVLPKHLPEDNALRTFIRQNGFTHVESGAGFMSLTSHVTIASLFARTRPGLYHYPHFNLPLAAPHPSVVTVQDLTPLATRDYFERHGTVKRWYFREALRSSSARASRIIVPSRTTADSLSSLIPSARAKLAIIADAADESFRTAPSAGDLDAARQAIGPGQFLLYVGSSRPHKNLEALLRAFARVAPHVPHRLVLGGQAVGDVSSLRRLARELGIGERIEWVGYVDPIRLRCLYRLADAFVLVSLVEGFGLGVVESLASGTPVVVSAGGASADVAGDAGLLVDPRSIDSIADGLRRICLDAGLRERLRGRGRERARAFTWERVAELTVDVYRKALGSS